MRQPAPPPTTCHGRRRFRCWRRRAAVGAQCRLTCCCPAGCCPACCCPAGCKLTCCCAAGLWCLWCARAAADAGRGFRISCSCAVPWLAGMRSCCGKAGCSALLRWQQPMHLSQCALLHVANVRPPAPHLTSACILTHPNAARDTIRADVYEYWRARRARLGRPLMRRLMAPTPVNDQNPYNVFR